MSAIKICPFVEVKLLLVGRLRRESEKSLENVTSVTLNFPCSVYFWIGTGRRVNIAETFAVSLAGFGLKVPVSLAPGKRIHVWRLV